MVKKVKELIEELNGECLKSIKSILDRIQKEPPEKHFELYKMLNTFCFQLLKKELSSINLDDFKTYTLLKEFNETELKVLELAQESIIKNNIPLVKGGHKKDDRRICYAPHKQ